MAPTNHDASKVLLGATSSNEKDVTQEPGDPAVCKAGLVVSKGSDGELDLGGAAGSFLGVSLGGWLTDSDSKKCGVVRNGLKVPVRLKDDNVFASLEVEDLTFTAKARGTEGNSVTIALVDGGTAGEETVEVDGNDVIVNMDDGVSTAQQIFDALEASEEAMEVLGVEITGTAGDAVAAFAEDALEGGTDAFAWVVVGDPVEIDGTTGEATENDEASGGVYASGVLDGINPLTGEFEAYCALVDFTGGV